MEQAQTNDNLQITGWLLNQWISGLGRILESMTDAKPVIRHKTEAEPVPQDTAGLGAGVLDAAAVRAVASGPAPVDAVALDPASVDAAASGAAGLDAVVLDATAEDTAGLGAVASGAAGLGEILWWQQAFSLSTEPALWAGASTAAWTGLGARTLRAAGIDSADAADAKSTYLEILNQSLAALAQAVSGRAEREVVCTAGEERQVAPALELFCVEVIYPDSDPCVTYLAINPAFASLVADQHAGVKPADAEIAERPEDVETRPFPDRLPPITPMALELLFDVELPVSVSFGHAHLPLKDVLKLSTGSIVELDRSIAEPVDILINNCVIARGEVVVMDGNYGVRIQHIVSRGERLLAQRGPVSKKD